MALPDLPIPPELAVDFEPFTDAELAMYFRHNDSAADLVAALESPGDYIPEMAVAARVHGWRIEEEDQAQWALSKLALAEAEIARLREQADEWIARIVGWFDRNASQSQQTAGKMNELLEDYGVRMRLAGADATLSYPSGVIKTTLAKPQAEVVDDAVVADYLERVTTQPPPDASDEACARYRVWLQAVEKMETPWPDLIKRTPKVYVGPLRKLVRVGEDDDGYDLRVVLACGHLQESVVALVDDLAIPSRGEVLACRECPADPIEGDARSAVDLIILDARKRPVVVGPDGEEVPGLQVKPGGVTAKASAR